MARTKEQSRRNARALKYTITILHFLKIFFCLLDASITRAITFPILASQWIHHQQQLSPQLAT
jgi:hypothetical protein